MDLGLLVGVIAVVWTIFESTRRMKGDSESRRVAQQAASDAAKSAAAAERSATAAEQSALAATRAVQLEEMRDEEARHASVKVLYWDSSGRQGFGKGLVVHNTGRATALEVEGQRLTPTGLFDASTVIRTLSADERRGIDTGWTSKEAPDGAPTAVPPSKYAARAIWYDPDGTRHASPWEVIEKL